MEEALRLRYQVYCKEKKFLDSASYKNHMECDKYDLRSSHFIVYGNEVLPLGYMRSIEHVEGDTFPLRSRKMEFYSTFDPPPSNRAVEISRMIVRHDLRHSPRDANDAFPVLGDLPNPPARNASDLTQLKLIRMAYHTALDRNVRWFYAAIEPSLCRKLNRMGFPMTPIGPPADYYGEVQPAIMDLRELEAILQDQHPAVWAFFENPTEDKHCKIILPGEFDISKICT